MAGKSRNGGDKKRTGHKRLALQFTVVDQKSLSSNGHVKMRFCIALLCILVALLAIIVGRVYQRLVNVPVPDDFPENSTWQFKLVGFSFGLAKDVVSCVSYMKLNFCLYGQNISPLGERENITKSVTMLLK